MKQDQWIKEVMGSLKGLQKAEGNPFLHTRVLAKLENAKSSKSGALKIVYALGSFVLVLLMLNLFLWSQPDFTATENNTVSTTVNEYDLTAIEY
jgi:hypothetical protein